MQSLLLLTMVTLGLAVGLSSEAAAQNYRYGIVTNILGSHNITDTRDLGAGWVRILMSWDYMETSPGVWQYGDVDEDINLASANGLKVFATLGAPPSWRRNSDGMPNDLNLWQDYVRRCIQRYAVERTDIEIVFSIENEPNFNHNITPAEYGTLFQRAHAARNAAKPSARLAGPNIYPDSSGSFAISSYVSAMGTNFKTSDVASVHIYPPQGGFSSAGAWMAYVAARVGGRHVWLTETNVCSLSSGSNIASIMTQFDSGATPNWKKTFIYILNSPDHNTCSLVDPSTGARRSKYNWYRDYISDHTWDGESVSLSVDSGSYYVKAVNGGGSTVKADATAVGEWETFNMIDLNGGDLMDGDKVAFQADNGQWLKAENGGGDTMLANGAAPNQWEQFTIRKQNGSGAIGSGDLIALEIKDSSGTTWYVVAEDGGGSNGVVNVNRQSIGTWEKFHLYRQ
jgi:hypothetical protein